jgi:hypothetical protein
MAFSLPDRAAGCAGVEDDAESLQQEGRHGKAKLHPQGRRWSSGRQARRLKAILRRQALRLNKAPEALCLRLAQTCCGWLQTFLRQAPDFLQSALRSPCMSLLRRQYGARLLNMVRSLSFAFSQAKRGNDEEHLQDAPMHHGKTIDMELLLWKKLYLFSLHWEFLEQQALSLPHYSGLLKQFL